MHEGNRERAGLPPPAGRPTNEAQPASATQRAAYTSQTGTHVVRLAPATAVRRRTPAVARQSAGGQAQQRPSPGTGEPGLPVERPVADSVPAPDVVRVWGEPIVQRPRSRQETGVIAQAAMLPAVAPIQAAGAEPLPAGAGAQTEGANLAPVPPSQPSGAGIDAPTGPREASSALSWAVRSGTAVEDTTGSGAPHGHSLSVVAPITPAAASGGLVRQDAARLSIRRAPQAGGTHTTVQAPAGSKMPADLQRRADIPGAERSAALPVVTIPAVNPQMPMPATRPQASRWGESAPAVPEQPEVAGVTGLLPLPGGTVVQARSAASAGTISAMHEHLPLHVQRQANGLPAAPTGPGTGSNAASPTASPSGARPAPAGESHARLDEPEMERVANTVIEMLRQRLMMEREARGL